MKKSLYSFVGLILAVLVSGQINAQSVDLSADPEASIKFTNPVQTSGMSFVNETNSGAEAFSESAILGKGIIPVKDVLDICRKTGGTKVYIVEQEAYQGKEPLACIKEDLEIMKKWGY